MDVVVELGLDEKCVNRVRYCVNVKNQMITLPEGVPYRPLCINSQCVGSQHPATSHAQLTITTNSSRNVTRMSHARARVNNQIQSAVSLDYTTDGPEVDTVCLHQEGARAT